MGPLHAEERCILRKQVALRTQFDLESKETFIGVVTQDPFGDAARFFGALRFDRDVEDRLNAAGQLSTRLQTNARANLLAGANRRRETNAIQATVNGLPHIVRQLNRLPHEMAHQGERQKAVRDRSAIGRFSPSAFGIDVNPLAVSRRVRELQDALLRHRQPIGRGDFPAHIVFQRLQGIKYEGWHGVSGFK